MKISKMREIPIVELLAYLGHKPTYRTAGGTQWVYHSPLRPDDTPSFSVSVRKNVWQDFGSSQGGNVIDLAIALNGGCSFHAAALWLVEQYKAFRGKGLVDIEEYDDGYNRRTDVRLVPLEKSNLLDYFHTRGILTEVATRYCKEIHYDVRGREYYAIGFPNILGGVEIRSARIKRCHGSKGPSILPVSKERRTDCCCVFEGFMDFLSYKTREMMDDKQIPQPFTCDCIVLNSTAMLKQAVPFIGVYSKAFCYLDRDDAGWTALQKLEELLPGKIVCCADRYELFGYGKDLNDYHKGHLDWDAWRQLEESYKVSCSASFHPAKAEYLPDEGALP